MADPTNNPRKPPNQDDHYFDVTATLEPTVLPDLPPPCATCRGLAEETRQEADGVAYRAVFSAALASKAADRCAALDRAAAFWEEISTTHLTANHRQYLTERGNRQP